jgi:hypothetical protein
MLAEQVREKKRMKHLEPAYREWMATWWQDRAAIREDLKTWDRTQFWSRLLQWGARVTPGTRAFVEQWMTAIGSARRVDHIMADAGLRDLVRDRERWLKRGRARIGNERALDEWTGESGAGRLAYRWNSPVRSFLRDLIAAQCRKG